eukprot:5428877-Prymnesium_polylepis.1
MRCRPRKGSRDPIRTRATAARRSAPAWAAIQRRSLSSENIFLVWEPSSAVGATPTPCRSTMAHDGRSKSRSTEMI